MPEYLETMVDKFTFKVATDRLYCQQGLWVLWVQPQSGHRVRIGLTDFLQQHSGDTTFMTPKPLGTLLQVGDDLAIFETIKVTITLSSPISGSIVAVNDDLELHPEFVNQSPYEKGWLVDIEASDWEAASAALLGPEAYFAVMKSEAEEEAKKL